MGLLDVGGGRVATVATFYIASELLGTGRYSEVYQAFDKHRQADVALKLYVGSDSKAHELAEHEVSVLKQLGQLNSECFPKLRHSARHRIHNQNHPLLVLELGAYVSSDGQKRIASLKKVIPQVGAATSEGQADAEFWAAESLVRWVIHMAQAVKQLHAIGIVHRDLKPANILLKRGPGQSASVPFFLDFNSAAASGELDLGTGTPRYLPPEVTSRRRQAPRPEDDLWAIAMVAWETIYGQGASLESPCSPHCLVTGSIPEAFIDVLRRALSIKVEGRFVDAGEMLQALEAATAAPEQTDAAPVLSSDEVVRARAAMERIRHAIGKAMAPPGEIFIPKETNDQVTTVIAWLSQEDTQSLNLGDDVVRLGPIAIPVCLQQGYRLHRDSVAYGELVTAIAKLGAQDRALAQRSIDMYALSSNVGVRDLCWRMCEELQYFPERLLDSLTEDEGILLPEERLKIADLCIRFFKDQSALLALVKYICREYMLDPMRYHDLVAVARRINELQFPKTALLIAQYTQNRIWEKLKEFEKLRPTDRPEIASGLIGLMAVAFAATGAAGLEVLKAGRIQRPAGPSDLPIFRRFATKLGLSNPDARSWLVKEASQHLDDRLLRQVVKNLQKQESVGLDNPSALLHGYLGSGDRRAYDAIRFRRTPEVLDLLRKHLAGGPSAEELDLILRLLKGHQSRQRATVVDAIVTHWAKLSLLDYDKAVDVLTAYRVPASHHQRAVDLLNRDLNGPHEPAARRGLERLLP